ncbi:MAG TPA: hypothetical protein VM534_00160 [Thermoanaerobaculia bacterium]|nr:hypothetical protein [Thermoanaerobaculia bacterium]
MCGGEDATALRAPTSSFTEVEDVNSYGGSVVSSALHQRIINQTGTYGHNVTYSTSTSYSAAGIIAVFKAAPVLSGSGTTPLVSSAVGHEPPGWESPPEDEPEPATEVNR